MPGVLMETILRREEPRPGTPNPSAEGSQRDLCPAEFILPLPKSPTSVPPNIAGLGPAAAQTP